MVCVMGYYLFKNAPISYYKHFIALYIICVIILMGHMYLQMEDFIRIGELSRRTSQRVFPYNSSSFGRSLVVALTMVISVCFCARKKIVWVFFSVLFVSACLPLLMIAGSRSSIVVLCGIGLIMVIVSMHSGGKRAVFTAVGVLSLCIVFAVVVFFFSKELLPANLTYRISKLVSHPISSIVGNVRVGFYEDVLMLVESAPTFGLGIRSYESAMQYPHNVIMEVLIESGVIGLVCFLLGICVLIVRCMGLLGYSQKYLPKWYPVVFVMVFSVASSWMFALLVGELSDHRVSYFILSVLLGLDHRIRTTVAV
jgi:O-antigen ligase